MTFRPPQFARPRRRHLAGVTLIEILLVLVLMGLAASGAAMGLGSLTRSHLKSACTRLVAASRFAYNHAIVNGKTARISFDLPGNSFSIEEAHAGVTLARADDERRLHVDEEGGEAEAAVDPWAAAAARLEEVVEPSFGASPFGVPKTAEGKPLKRYSNVDLGDIRIVRLIVAHEAEPREQGKGAVHFFAGGYGEHAVIHLSDGGDTVYSVEIHPLTGRAEVHSEAYEPETLLDDPAERQSEVQP